MKTISLVLFFGTCFAERIKLYKEVISTWPIHEPTITPKSPLVGVMPGGDPKVRYYPYNWPQGIVKFAIHDRLNDNYLLERIRKAMSQIEQSSCLKFEPIEEPPEEGPWLNITNVFNTRNCVHFPHIILATGEVQIELGYDCLKKTQIIHTLMHGLGFEDEVTHPHRDKYVRIMWSNILPEYKHLFRLREHKEDEELAEYDPSSVMQFNYRSFSRNGEPVMSPLSASFVNEELSGHLSMLDRLKLNLKFKHECNKRNVQKLMNSCKNLLNDDVANDGDFANMTGYPAHGSYANITPYYSDENFANMTGYEAGMTKPAIGSFANMTGYGKFVGMTGPAFGDFANMTGYGKFAGMTYPAFGGFANMTGYGKFAGMTGPAFGDFANMTGYGKFAGMTYPAFGGFANMTGYGKFAGMTKPAFGGFANMTGYPSD